MFSTNQLDMIRPLVESYFVEGYQYYIVHSNTNLNNSDSYNFYDVTLYFSKEPITFNNYTFVLSNDSIKVDYMTRNVSNNNQDRKVNRLVSRSVNGSVSVPSYEHIISNSESSNFMDIMALVEYEHSNSLNYNISVNDFFVPSFILAMILLYLWLKSWFGKNYRGVSYD